MKNLKAAFTSFPYCIATYVGIVGMVWLLAFGYRPSGANPTLTLTPDPLGQAVQLANKLGGRAHVVSDTGSMRPVLDGGDYVAVVSAWDKVKKGDILVYRATYNANPIVHRAAAKDAHGWIMSGDSAKHSESWARVTEANYLGTVVHIFRKGPL